MSPKSFAKFTKWMLRSRLRQQNGFTLLELLVAILIGGILVNGLLFLVIELMTVNNREESLTQTQQNMRRAIDYITRDVGEAIFVYSDLTDLMTELSDEPTGTPVLAFWRLDPLTNNEGADLASFCTGKTGAVQEECETLLVRQNYYTLVVYFQQDNTGTDIWEGPTRIVRYELPNYTSISTSALTVPTGYADPTLLIPSVTPETFNSFGDWQAGGATTDGNAAVLTDFVNVSDVSVTTACPTPANPASTSVRLPATSDSFYVCVEQPNGISDEQSSNRSLVVYLQGNASKGAANQVVGLSESSSLPKLQSEVLIRGVVQNDATTQ